MGTITAAAGYDTPTFSWSSVAGAGSYYLYVADNLTPQQPLIANSSITGTSFTPDLSQALTPGHSYTWYIGAVSTNGIAVAWSAPQSLSLPSLVQPTQIGPSGAIPASTGYEMPTFSWNPVPGASSYYLYVLDTTTNKPAAFDTTTTALGGASFTPSAAQALTPGDRYTWYIGAEGAFGAKGPIAWSGQTFSLAATTPPAPTLYGPAGPLRPALATIRPHLAGAPPPLSTNITSTCSTTPRTSQRPSTSPP